MSINHILPESLFDSEGNKTAYYDSLPRAVRKALFEQVMHPARVRAEFKSKERAKEHLLKKADLKAMQEMNGFRFIVFGRLTVCYRRVKNVLYISTVLRNQKDKDDPLSAKMVAAYRIMLKSQYIVVPTNKDVRAKQFIQDMFFPTVW